MSNTKKLIYICEVCGKTEVLTPEEAFELGWDYPLYLSPFGVVSPRTCADCYIYRTLYWTLQTGKSKNLENLSEKQKETLNV